jgi:hypothetical protein
LCNGAKTAGGTPASPHPDTNSRFPASNSNGACGDAWPFFGIKLILGYLFGGPPLEELVETRALRSAAHRLTLVTLTFESSLGGMEQFCENIRSRATRVFAFFEYMGRK